MIKFEQLINVIRCRFSYSERKAPVMIVKNIFCSKLEFRLLTTGLRIAAGTMLLDIITKLIIFYPDMW